MPLGTLQKFSLRRACQTVMIDAGMVGWMVAALDAHAREAAGGAVSEYTTEYGTALLMNLSLRRIGRAADGKRLLHVHALQVHRPRG